MQWSSSHHRTRDGRRQQLPRLLACDWRLRGTQTDQQAAPRPVLSQHSITCYRRCHHGNYITRQQPQLQLFIGLIDSNSSCLIHRIMFILLQDELICIVLSLATIELFFIFHFYYLIISCTILLLFFTARPHCLQCRALRQFRPSVRLSVRLSHAGIVPRRMKIG